MIESTAVITYPLGFTVDNIKATVGYLESLSSS